MNSVRSSMFCMLDATFRQVSQMLVDSIISLLSESSIVGEDPVTVSMDLSGTCGPRNR